MNNTQKRIEESKTKSQLVREAVRTAYIKLGRVACVAQKFGFSCERVIEILDSRGVDRQKREIVDYSVTDKMIIKSFKRLGTVDKVRRELKIDVLRITKVLDSKGIERQRHNTRLVTDEMIIELFSQLGNVEEVRIALRVGRRKVYKALDDNNTQKERYGKNALITDEEILNAFIRLGHIDNVYKEFNVYHELNIDLARIRQAVEDYGIQKLKHDV